MLANRDYEKVDKSECVRIDDKSSRPQVTIFDCIENDYTVITMRSKDKPNLLFDTVCTLTDMLYVVFHGVVHTGRMEAFSDVIVMIVVVLDSSFSLTSIKNSFGETKELQSALGGKAVSLPQVFIRGKHIGGVDEIKQLHEVGELAKLLEGFSAQDPGIVCDNCGDARIVSCLNCNGSRKVFEEEEGKLRRCSDCNENGLISCPNCCS
ncbi:unnamed protein product [Ilex paraguariensis]|uniref:Glutaredoxin domain-containing protein n=1 Tax=Ilex paraguariensis TaxID=185542 RepID=A0ABC8QQT5_9AQUA